MHANSMRRRRSTAPPPSGCNGAAHPAAAHEPAAPRRPSSLRDELPAVVLLVVLYMLQGVPLGLSMGSM